MKPLRVGIIIDNVDQGYLVSNIINFSRRSNYYEVVALIIQNSIRSEGSFWVRLKNYIKRRGLKKLAESLLILIIEKIEELFISNISLYKHFFVKTKISDIDVENKLFVRPSISPSGLIYRYEKKYIDEIIKLDIDVLIRGGGGIFRGEILTACKYGILSLHHGDSLVNRGGPPGFWEVYNREAATGFIIQKLNDELDGGDVLFKGLIPTRPIYSLNKVRIYLKSSIFFVKVLEKLAKNGLASFYLCPPQPYAFKLYTTPSLRIQAIYIIKTIYILLKKIYYKIIKKSQRWSIAYQFVENWKSAVLWKSAIIKNIPDHFFADPFHVAKDGQLVIYAEDYNYSLKRGNISGFRVTENGYDFLGPVINEEFHLSYPFIYEYRDALYMIPETHERKEIRLYKCIDFPMKWSYINTLIGNVSAVDTNVFFMNDKFWIFTNIDSSNIDEHNSELHIFYSDSLCSNNWIAHDSNPVIFDSRIARNAGIIADSDNFYRVFQTQGFDVYGESVGISKILTLTCSEYKEELVASIPPKFKQNLNGLHTFSYRNGFLSFDFSRVERYRL